MRPRPRKPPTLADVQKVCGAREVGRPLRRDPGQRRRPARLHGPDLAEALRRPARRRRAGVGRREGRAATRRRLRPGQQPPVLELKADRHQLRQGARLRFADHAAGRTPRSSTSTCRAARRPAPSTPRPPEKAVTGVAAVAKAVPFKLSAPATLVGLPAPRGPPRRLEGQEGGGRHLRPGPRRHGRDRAAGRARRAAADRGGGRGGLQLPKVSINGATGEELDTALATMIRFDARRRRLHGARLGARRRRPQAAARGPPDGARAPVEVRGLVKRYGEIVAVDNVDLTVEAGDVYGYLGPNGAGKTTSLRMMLGLIRPDRRPGPAVRPRPAGRGRGARGRGRLRRGAALLPLPERPPQPRAAGRVRRRGRGRADRRRARRGRAHRSRQGQGRRLLARHAPAPRASPRRCCATRSCCCSTSPPPASTRRACATCAR